VYVVGSVIKTTQISPNLFYTTHIATMWKNGAPTYLTDALHFSNALSIVVSGNDVYVAGFAAQTAQQNDTAAVYWKNGQLVTLSTISGSNASSVFVAESDIYVGGNVYAGGMPAPAYRKNGTATVLIGSSASQIVVSGGDVYVAGNNYPTAPILPAVVHGNATGSWIGATYWKNAYPVPLLPNGQDSASGIVVVTP
jgi:hypothetical protein